MNVDLDNPQQQNSSNYNESLHSHRPAPEEIPAHSQQSDSGQVERGSLHKHENSDDSTTFWMKQSEQTPNKVLTQKLNNEKTYTMQSLMQSQKPNAFFSPQLKREESKESESKRFGSDQRHGRFGTISAARARKQLSTKVALYLNNSNHEKHRNSPQHSHQDNLGAPGSIKHSMRIMQFSISNMIEKAQYLSNQRADNSKTMYSKNLNNKDVAEANLETSKKEKSDQSNLSDKDRGLQRNLVYSNVSITYDDDKSQQQNNRLTKEELELQQVRLSQLPYDETMLNQKEVQIFQLLSKRGNEENLQSLLQNTSFRILLNLRDNSGYSALHLACSNNSSSYVQIILSSILSQIKDQEENVVNHSQTLIENDQLLQEYQDLSIKSRQCLADWINQRTMGDEEQFTAIHHAAFNGNLSVMKLLIKYGGDVFMPNSQNINCMHFAAQGNQPRVLNFLHSEYNFEIDTKDINGCTPLHWACVSGSYQALRYLLAFGADPNAITVSDGATPIQLAIKNMDETREVRVIHKLLLYGANIDIKDNNGVSTIAYLKSIEDDDIRQQCQDLFKNLNSKKTGFLRLLSSLIKQKNVGKLQKSRAYLITLVNILFLQLLCFVFYIFPTLSFYPENIASSWSIQVQYIVFCSIIIGLFIFLIQSDPGTLKAKKQKKKDIEQDESQPTFDELMEQVDFKLLCPECKLFMTERARHCYICKSCVDRFDHHCDWLDNCIGSKNHKYFFVFILFLFVFQVLIISIFVDTLVCIFRSLESFTPSTHFLAFFGHEFYNIWVANSLICVFGIVAIIFLIPMGALIVLHVRNLAQNITTQERYSKKNTLRQLDTEGNTYEDFEEEQTDAMALLSNDLFSLQKNTLLSSDSVFSKRPKHIRSAKKDCWQCFDNCYIMCYVNVQKSQRELLKEYKHQRKEILQRLAQQNNTSPFQQQ